MQQGTSEELRACVSRNQELIDTLLTRRAQDERRCDLYQRIQQAQDKKTDKVKAATAALQKELLATLEQVYLLERFQVRQEAGTVNSPRSDLSTKVVDAAHQVRASLLETQRYNEALRVEVLQHASTCDALQQAVQAKEVHCCAVQDQLDAERRRSTRMAVSVAPAPATSPHHTSHSTQVERADAASPRSFAEALLLDTTQYYQRASGAARDGVVDYIALQDEFYAHLRRRPAHAIAPASFEASLLHSVQLFLNTYTQLRRQEQQRYQEILRTVTRLLKEAKA